MHALHTISVVSLVVSAVCALFVAGHIVAGHRQKMMVMNFVWPITALWAGPLGVWVYWTLGRRHEQAAHDESRDNDEQPFWQKVAVSDTHCGAGCTVGDVAGEFAVLITGFTLAGSVLWANYLVDFVLALSAGLAFQYFAIQPMRHLPPGQGVLAALKADSLSLISFEVGMFAWMAFARFVIFGRDVSALHAEHWFMMQIAMLVGFATAYPVNWMLVRAGVKEAM